jgi:hypothetical protein
VNSVMAAYSKIDDPVKAADQLGTWLAQSQMMGAITAQQGKLLAFDILARGVPITEPILMYYVVANRLTMKADVMLAEFNAAGGKHRILENTADAAEIELTDGEQVHSFRVSWEEAKQEPWPYGKDGKTLKPTWAGPVGRADMMWARAVSRGVRKVKPSVVAGRYTPEEIQDLPEYAEAISSNGKPAEPVDVEQLLRETAARNGTAPKPPKPPASSTTTSTVAADEPAGSAPVNHESDSRPVSASSSSNSNGEQDTLQATAETLSPPAVSEDGYATAAQATCILDLFIKLNVPVDAQEKALKKRGASTVRGLTVVQAAELISSLVAKVRVTEQQAVEFDVSKMPPNVTSYPDSAPCLQPQIEAIVQLVKEIGENDPEFPAKYKARLQAQGKQRTADLSVRQADAMLGVLGFENLSAFFDRSLEQLTEEYEERAAIQAQ